jgi:hypothetical protein
MVTRGLFVRGGGDRDLYLRIQQCKIGWEIARLLPNTQHYEPPTPPAEAHKALMVLVGCSFDASKLAIVWYGGRYDSAYGSVLPRGRGDAAAAVDRCVVS